MHVGMFWLVLHCWIVGVVAPPPGHSTCQNQRATLAGSHHGKDSEDSCEFAGGVRKVAFSPDWSSDLGEFGPEAHRRFVRLLEDYMVHMYVTRQSRRAAAETLNMVVQQFGWLKSSLAGPWNIIRAWEGQEPPTHHPPLPLPILRALVACALAWQWPKLGVLLALGFFALLRPAEFIGLRRQDLSLPEDHLELDVVYVRIGLPKTRFRSALNQHVRVDEPGIASWIAWMLRCTPMYQRIWNGSLAAFRKRYELLQRSVLGKVCFLPSSLRPGGATYLFRLFNEDLVRLQ